MLFCLNYYSRRNSPPPSFPGSDCGSLGAILIWLSYVASEADSVVEMLTAFELRIQIIKTGLKKKNKIRNLWSKHLQPFSLAAFNRALGCGSHPPQRRGSTPRLTHFFRTAGQSSLCCSPSLPLSSSGGLWRPVHSVRVGGLQRDAKPPEFQPSLALLLHFRHLCADGHLHPGLAAPWPLQLVLRRWTLGPRLDQDLLGGLSHAPLLPPRHRLRAPRWHGCLLRLHSEIQSGSKLPRGSATCLGPALPSWTVLQQPLRCPGNRLGELPLLVLQVLPALRGMHPQSPLPAPGGRKPPD